MRKHLAIASLAVAAVVMPLTAAVAASGTPQRSSEVPPGLWKALSNGALVTTLQAAATLAGDSVQKCSGLRVPLGSRAFATARQVTTAKSN